jgi:hypothetical protein
MTLKLFHAHYRVIDSSLGFARCLDEGDTTLVIDTEDEGDFNTAIATERAKLAEKHDIAEETYAPKIVFTSFNLLHSEEAIALSNVDPMAAVVKCFEGDRVVASVKSSQPRFL